MKHNEIKERLYNVRACNERVKALSERLEWLDQKKTEMRTILPKAVTVQSAPVNALEEAVCRYDEEYRKAVAETKRLYDYIMETERLVSLNPNESERYSIMFRFFNGDSYRDIDRKLRVSEGYARKLVHKGIRRIEAITEGKG